MGRNPIEPLRGPDDAVPGGRDASVRVPASEVRWVAAAFALLLVHNGDEAFGHPEHGGWTNLGMTAVIALFVALFYRRLGWRWRAVICGLVGLDALFQGFLGYVVHILDGTAHPLDWSGLLFAAGGAILLWNAITLIRTCPVAPRALPTGRT